MNYATNYPLPDPGVPPADVHQMVLEAMEERIFSPGEFTHWEWKRRLFVGASCWELRLLPMLDATRPRLCLVMERAINAESDPDKALVLFWRYRGRKKETMRSLQGLQRPLADVAKTCGERENDN